LRRAARHHCAEAKYELWAHDLLSWYALQITRLFVASSLIRCANFTVTGASRGIGLALVTKLLETRPDAFVFATTRVNSADLNKLHGSFPTALRILTLDVEDESQYASLTDEIRGLTDRLDYVIANAGKSFTRCRDSSYWLIYTYIIQD
jgi:nucleoside-diphosphate-sugar epimerase